MPLPPLAPRCSHPAPHHRPRRPLRSALLAGTAGLLLTTMVLTVAASAPTLAQPGAEVGIEKTTNGDDADTAPGPQVGPDQAVDWVWTVSAVGAATLYDLVVGDSSSVVPDCDVTGDGAPDGTNIHPGPLEPGQSFICTAPGAADHDPAAGVYAATGTVRASDFAATATFEAADPSHHHVVAPDAPEPGLSIAALVDGQVATGTDGALVAAGVATTWTFVVSNTGNAPLSGVEVGDESGLVIDCGAGSPIVPGQLAPGASVSCTAVGPPLDRVGVARSLTGSAVASALHPTTGAPLGQVSASDIVTYTPVQVPAQLAFTGPTSPLVPLGFILTGVGVFLLAMTRRRPAEAS